MCGQRGVAIAVAHVSPDAAWKTLDIMQKAQKRGAGLNQQALTAVHDRAFAESTLVATETNHAESRFGVPVYRVLSRRMRETDCGAKAGVVEASHSE
jgi:hypothetical protein